jgi:hypothetical protein
MRPLAVITGASTGIGRECARGRTEIVSGWQNKLLALAAHVTPASILARRNRQVSMPESRPGDAR